MADPHISADELGEFRRLIKEITRRISELEKPTGTQLSKAVEKIFALLAEVTAILNSLDTKVAASIAAQSYTRTQIDAKWSTQDTAIAGKEPAFGVLSSGKGGTGTGNVYSTTSTGSQLQVFVRPDGMLTVGASSERFKQDIDPWMVDAAAVLALPARQFRWRSEVAEWDEPAALQQLADDGGPADPAPAPTNAPLDFGLIAEEAAAAGLDWLVRYGEDGTPDGVQYQRLPIAHHEIIRAQQAHILALEERLTALERKDTP